MKKILKGAIVAALVLLILGIGALGVIETTKRNLSKNRIVSTNFIGFDFARAVVGSESDIKMLLKPGADLHSYEPTPQDIVDIENAELFIYMGGESDEWVEKLIKNNEILEEKTLRLMDYVEPKKEEIVFGMEEDDEEDVDTEYDEHIWTSPINAIKLVEGIRDKLSEINPEKTEEYFFNSERYIDSLMQVDEEFREIVEGAGKKELIFGDRFPFRYFTDEYELEYYAAFPGCSEQTEASSSTIAFLIDKAKKDGIKTILKVELTNGKLAQTIAEAVDGQVKELSAAHNISEEDFENGVTYVDVMKRNAEVLAEALK